MSTFEGLRDTVWVQISEELLQLTLRMINLHYLCYYRMGKNFWGWLNFAVFKGTSQTVENNPGKIFVRLCPRKNTCRRWARQTQEWRSFVTFIQPLITEEKVRVLFFSPSLVHWSTSTITQLIRKGCGNYTHNKSAKIKTFEHLIIKMFWQKRKILTPRNFVPIQ